MRQSASLILATGASLLLHGLLLGAPGWDPFGPGEPESPPVLHATLAPVPESVPAVTVPVAPPAPQPVKRPKPRPKPAADAAPIAVIAAADTQADAASAVAEEPVPPAPLAETPAPAQEPVASAATPEVMPAEAPSTGAHELKGVSIAGWPRHGSIRFRTLLGEGGFVVGEARHEWAHDEARYTMSVTLQTTGVVGVFRTFHYAQRSEGSVGPEGLRPELFSVEQTSKTPSSAVFDWNAGQVSLRRGTRERVAAIQPGDQDLLSLWHQIGIVGASREATQLTVVGGREATPAAITVMGPETQVLPIGRLDTLRVHAASLKGGLSIDIWLANRYGMLPVRIRIVDEKGEILDQQAIELRLSPPDKSSEGEGGAAIADNRNMIELRAEDPPPAHSPFGN